MIRAICRCMLLISALCLAVPLAQASPLAAQLFGQHAQPSRAAPMPHGSYARGCADGLVALPDTGPSWQVMRPSRNRAWGHPEMIALLKELSEFAQTLGWAGLYIGDISQPRGGPMASGHASHQIGLDADVWLLAPRKINLSRAARENAPFQSVRSADQRSLNANWTSAHAALLQRAARDPRVDRIFITPPAKIALCKAATLSDRDWLQKIRPYYGHDAHFHIRLKCPAGADTCQPQTPTVDTLSQGGDGCDASLQWWVTDYLTKPVASAKVTNKQTDTPRPKGARALTLTDLPKTCHRVVQTP
jgi:penicillin-insensitive murein DD-endopeptidase